MNRKTIARFAGISAAAAMTFGVFAPVGAQTIAELQAQIAALMAQLQSLSGGSTASSAAITSDLTVGSSGSEVVTLQTALVSQGYLVMPAGTPMGYFGTLTKDAVAKWQAAKGLPATGYFGPMSRAAFGGSTTGGSTTGGTTTGGGSTSLQGGEGTLDINGELADVETEVDEGDEEVNVFGLELEADDSDIMIERVDVDFDMDDAAGAESDNLDDYITEVQLILDGKTLATLDVDEGDEDSTDVFSFRFSGLNGVIEEGETGELYVAVTAVNNIDGNDVNTVIEVGIPASGIRAVDAAGISETYDGGYTGNGTGDYGSFSVTEPTGGDLEISEGNDNPEGQVVTIDEDDNTDDILVLAFELEADNQDVTVDDIPVGLVTSENEGVDGPVRRVYLVMDGDTLDSVTVPASAGTSYQALFEDLDIEIEDGDTAEFEVYVDLNDADVDTFATGTTLYATTTGSDANWDVEDNEGDAVTPSGSVSNSGDLLVFQTEGISVELVSVSAEKTTALSTGVTAEVGEFKIVVDITAVGEDMWIDKDATADPDRGGTGSAGTGFQWATTTQSTTGTTTVASVLTAGGSTSGDSATGYKINSGSERRFTLTVSLSADTSGVAAVQLTGINYDTDSTVSDSTTFYTSNLSDFKTDLLTLLSS